MDNYVIDKAGTEMSIRGGYLMHVTRLREIEELTFKHLKLSVWINTWQKKTFWWVFGISLTGVDFIIT